MLKISSELIATLVQAQKPTSEEDGKQLRQGSLSLCLSLAPAGIRSPSPSNPIGWARRVGHLSPWLQPAAGGRGSPTYLVTGTRSARVRAGAAGSPDADGDAAKLQRWLSPNSSCWGSLRGLELLVRSESDRSRVRSVRLERASEKSQNVASVLLNVYVVLCSSVV